MKLSHLQTIVNCLCFVGAGVVHLDTARISAFRILANIAKQNINSAQKPLENFARQEHSPTWLKPTSSGSGQAQTGRLPLQEYNDGFLQFYSTHISLGTPPQLFRAFVILNWADLFVPSINCTYSWIPNHHLRYDSYASSTYENGPKITDPDPPWWNATSSMDTLRIGNLEIPHTPFLEMTVWDGLRNIDTQVDGILGLAFSTPLEVLQLWPSQLPSPFRTMITEGSLGLNLFSVLLPQVGYETGELLFGGTNPSLYKGSLSSHPLHPPNTTHWQVEATALSLTDEHGTTLVSASLAGCSAFFEFGVTDIIFPQAAYDQIIDAMNPDYPFMRPGFFCERVPHLPDVVLNLGGHEYSLKSSDYMIKQDNYNEHVGENICIPIFAGSEDMAGGNDDAPLDLVVLGNYFLRKFYTVYDYDRKTISLAEANHEFT